MIVFTTEHHDGACVVHLEGSFKDSDESRILVSDLVAEARGRPLLIDLSGVEPAAGPSVTVFLRGLAAAPSHVTTALIHPDPDIRRVLRAQAQGLPVVPNNDLVMQGRFASALVAQPQPAVQPERTVASSRASRVRI
jgi:hypothetical protein